MLAGVKVADRNVSPIIAEHGVETFKRILGEVLDRSERLLREEIKQIPDGTYSYVDYLDGDGIDNKLFRMQVTLTIKGADAALDFTGTDPQAKGFINASYWNTLASSYSAFFLFFDPKIPRNEGFFRPISITVPKGTLLNPTYPAPVGASTTEGGGRVYDLVLGALSQAWPERAFATWSMMWVAVYIAGTHPETGKPFIQGLSRRPGQWRWRATGQGRVERVQPVGEQHADPQHGSGGGDLPGPICPPGARNRFRRPGNLSGRS